MLRSTKPITFDESIISGVVGEVNGSLALWDGELSAVCLTGSHQHWRGSLLTMFFQELLYGIVSNINNVVYQHEVHAEGFVHPVHLEINTQSTEGLWMHAKCKLRYQCDTSRSV